MTGDAVRPTDMAIVGMAALFPGAPDLASFWDNIVAGTDAITEVPATRWDAAYHDPDAWSQPASDRFYCHRGGFIDDIATFEPARFGIMPVVVDSTDPDQLLALRLAADAVADAGGEQCLGDRRRVGVILGRGGYLSAAGARLEQRTRVIRQLVATLTELLPDLTSAQLEKVRSDFLEQLGPERPDASIGLVPNLAASRIANRLDLQGPAYTVDAACASSLLAVDHAADELARGRCDVVIAGGVHVCDDVGLWSVFSQLRALSPTGRIRPFDRRADGLLIGEGLGMVVLRRLADAERRGDRVYAVVRGTGVASDGRGSSLMRPRIEGQVLALQRAWAAADLDPAAPGAVTMVEAHGTATPVGDESELETLRTVFGTAGPPIGLGTVKSMIGHAMPAAGIAGVIKAALALHHRVLPPTLHCEEPNPALAGGRLEVLTDGRPWEESDAHTSRRAAVNAFGFGGINAHVVLQEAPTATPGAWAPPMARRPTGVTQRVVLVAGGSAQELAAQLAVSDAELLARDDILAVPSGGPWRVAIVDPNPTRLELARKVSARGRPWRGRNDVWFTATPLLADAKLAFVFPGVEQTFNPRVEGVAAHFGLPDPGRPDTDTLGRHSVATVAVGRLLDGALRQLGIEPDVLGGHSVGEWNAMIAAGMHDGDDIDAIIASFAADNFEVPGLVFAALGCGAEMAEVAIVGLERITVSHDNCPHQSVICGEETSVADALDRLRAEGVMGQVLSFRSGFHSPMLAPYLGPVGRLFEGLALRSRATPVWSATIAAPFPDDAAAVHDLAIRHLLEPVRFGPMVRRMHDDGVRGFVQVGSGSLTGFIDDVLRGRDQLVISATTPANGGLDQLLRVAAGLWVEGRTPNFARLAPAASAKATPAVRLRLGAPTVQLGAEAAPLVVAPTPRGANGHPVLAEFDAVLADAAAAADTVLRSWNAGPHRAAPTATEVPVPRAEAGAPARLSSTRLVSLETMPYLVDHCFYQQAAGWPDISDQFPVVPMTTMLEMLMEGAAPLAVGRTMIGLVKVRALRWLAPTKPVTVTVTATVDRDGNIDVALEGYAQAKVLVADQYPTAPAPRTEALHGVRPSPVSTAEVYRQRWLFHGPAFQGITDITAFAEDGIAGQLVSLAAPGGLLDNAGQLMGLWIEATVEENKLPFPAAIERLEFFGPHPTPGSGVECTVWIRSMTDTLVTSDIEVRRDDGTVFARVTGWTDRRFRTVPAYDPMLRRPEHHRVTDAQPAGWFLLRDYWNDPANRELMMRRYLGAGEQQQYESQPPRGRHRWLLGRIVAKDAARQWLWDRGAGPIFPAEVVIGNEASGRPTASGLPPGVGISIAHAGECAVALVGPASGVGIDVERVEARSEPFEAAAFTETERSLLDRLAAGSDSRAAVVTQFWVAKEAVAKAIGTGLGGRPQRFEVTAVGGSRLAVTARDDPSQWWVDTTTVAGGDGASQYVVGWTTAAAQPDGVEDGAAPAARGRTLVQERTTHGR